MAVKRKKFGTVLAYSTNDSSYTDLTDLARVKWPKFESEDAEITHLSSPNQTKEYLADGGWKDTDLLEVEAYFTETQFNTLLGKVNTQVEEYWRMTMPTISGQTTGPRVKLQGYVKSHEIPEISFDSSAPIMCAFTIKRSTALPTFTAGA